MSPSGSKIELMVASIPLQVLGLSFKLALSLNASDSIHHRTSRALSIANFLLPESRPPDFSLLCFQGVLSSSPFDVADHFFSLNPPCAHIPSTEFTNSASPSSVETDFNALLHRSSSLLSLQLSHQTLLHCLPLWVSKQSWHILGMNQPQRGVPSYSTF